MVSKGQRVAAYVSFYKRRELESVCQRRRSQQGGQAEDSTERTSLTQRVLGTCTWGAGAGNPVLTEMVRWGPEEREGVGLGPPRGLMSDKGEEDGDQAESSQNPWRL